MKTINFFETIKIKGVENSKYFKAGVVYEVQKDFGEKLIAEKKAVLAENDEKKSKK